MNKDRVKSLRKTLGANIRKARTRLAITQERMAEQLEMSPEVYGRMERGLIFPRVERLLDICEKLGVSSDQLLGLSVLEVAAAPSVRHDEWLTLFQRFSPVMPRLTQHQRKAVRRHLTDFQRLLVTFVELKPGAKRERRGRHPT